MLAEMLHCLTEWDGGRGNLKKPLSFVSCQKSLVASSSAEDFGKPVFFWCLTHITASYRGYKDYLKTKDWVKKLLIQHHTLFFMAFILFEGPRDQWQAMVRPEALKHLIISRPFSDLLVMYTDWMDYLKRITQGWEVYSKGWRTDVVLRKVSFSWVSLQQNLLLEMTHTWISCLECSLYSERFAKIKLRDKLFLV